MDRAIEKRISARAVDLGNSGNANALPEFDVYIAYRGMDTETPPTT